MKIAIPLCIVPGLFMGMAGFGQAGSLDSTFGHQGIVTTDFKMQSNDNAFAIATQADGKMIVAGSTGKGFNNEFALIRYNTNGTPDTGFGKHGKMATDIHQSADVAHAISIVNDGKILIAGSADIYNGSRFVKDFALVRYNSNGTIDSAFGVNGKMITDFDHSEDIGYSMAIDESGKIIVAGSTMKNFKTSIALSRYYKNGKPDYSFGDSGKIITSIGHVNDVAESVLIQPDGKIVVTGYSFSGSNFDIALVRYNSNGRPDNNFGVNGIVTTDFGNGDDAGNAVAIRPGGKIVVAGYTYNGSDFDFALAQYKPNGKPDIPFGNAGRTSTDILGYHDESYGIVLQPDGKIIAGGIAYNAAFFTNADLALVRYKTDGRPDSSFGKAGRVTTPVGNSEDYGQAITLQADGKIVMAGFSELFQSTDFVVARYNGTDKTVNNAGAINITERLTTGVKIYPNPARDRLTIEVPDPAFSTTLSIQNNSGKVMEEIVVTIIDCGSHGAGLLEFLHERDITKVKRVYLSHADQDHIGGLLSLLANEKIIIDEVFLNSDGSKNTKLWDDLITVLDDKNRSHQIKFEVSIHDELPTLNAGGIKIDAIGPSKYLVAKGSGNSERKGRKITSNSISASFVVSYNEQPLVFLSGDIDQISLDEIFYSKKAIKARVLVFPHHGGKIEEGNLEEFASQLIAAAEPTTVIFSIGRRKFSNPRPEVINAVRKSGIKFRIACTQLSQHCCKNLPTENYSHLHAYYAKGKYLKECCGGTYVINLDEEIQEYPNYDAHQKFIDSAAASPLCR